MPTKQDPKWIRQNIATTRQAVANAQKRTVPKFKHPTKGKAAPPASPAPPTDDAPAAEAEPEPDAE